MAEYRSKHSAPAADGAVTVEVFAEPDLRLPAVVRKVLGRLQAYYDSNTLYPKTFTRVGTVVPASALAAAVVDVSYEQNVVATADGECELRLAITAAVKVPLLGGVLERFILEQSVQKFGEQEGWTVRYLASPAWAERRDGLIARCIAPYEDAAPAPPAGLPDGHPLGGRTRVGCCG